LGKILTQVIQIYFWVKYWLQLGGLAVAVLGGLLIQVPAAHATPPNIISTPGSDPSAAIAGFPNGSQTATATASAYRYTFRSSARVLLKTPGIDDSGAGGSSS
jgi:hypothetical protein